VCFSDGFLYALEKNKQSLSTDLHVFIKTTLEIVCFLVLSAVVVRSIFCSICSRNLISILSLVVVVAVGKHFFHCREREAEAFYKRIRFEEKLKSLFHSFSNFLLRLNCILYTEIDSSQNAYCAMKSDC